MKKIISFLLACCVLVCFVSPDISADAQHVVGDSVEGVESFTEAQNSAQFHVQIVDQAHRYAVDLEYSSLTISFVGGLTWDVNTLEYVYEGDADENTATKEVTMTIINHSDLPIMIEPSIEAAEDVNVNFDYRFSTGENFIAGLQMGDAEKTNTLHILATPVKSWSDIAASAGDDESIALGTVTITIKEMDEWSKQNE